jgi:hypothetical protein
VRHIVCIVIHCVIPDLRRRVQDLRSCGMLRSYQRLGTTYLSLLKMGPIDCPETSVTTYQSTLRNIPEERRSRVIHSVLQLVTHKARVVCCLVRHT